ncbi:MOSC domain-containing protein YiiM [Thermosyntropha lipolytica DSM 11003]|uniref:MOSC domain-containing protein YiiM n=1 Tax=Thermosyntropha lipolytica DSM 11003 TaxID=1123382 RepID=A0A1M5NGD5_9FIRM|nr:MOSC domain-containing protein [Thermosyntropha lipolytica]SHG88033.1 MOSC domain-containing protein YiiM [Thermosyntropha lipolytica DSM 11003]
MQGKVLAVNISEKKGEKKHNIGKAYIRENWGIEGDAHSGEGLRQVSLLSYSSIEKMKKQGLNPVFGDFAENLTVEGIDVFSLPIGTRLKVGEAVLKITAIGKECHNQGCAIKRQVGKCVMPLEGVFARVIKSGWVKAGDSIEVMEE